MLRAELGIGVGQRRSVLDHGSVARHSYTHGATLDRELFAVPKSIATKSEPVEALGREALCDRVIAKPMSRPAMSRTYPRGVEVDEKMGEQHQEFAGAIVTHSCRRQFSGSFSHRALIFQEISCILRRFGQTFTYGTCDDTSVR